MEEENPRRNFLKKGLLGTSFVMLASVDLKAFSFKNPGQDAKRYKYTGDKSKHYVMVIDLRKCVGCQACTATCIMENNVPDEQHRTFVSELELGEYPNTRKAFLPQLCNHCENPACVSVCPTGATFKRDDGLVLVDNEICWGCGYCISACPYDKRFFNKKTKTADKCTFCAHRVDKGLLPACVETCVGGARVFGDINDKETEVYKLISNFSTQVLKPSQGTKPQVFYIGLDSRLTQVLDSTQSLDDLVKKQIGMQEEWMKTGLKEENND